MTQSRHLPSQVLDHVARDAAGDAPVSLLAQAYGYTPEGMRKLLLGDDMRRRIDQQRAVLDLKARMIRTQFLVAAPKAVENITSIADDTTHKDSFNANKFIVERAAPEATDVNVNVRSDVMDDLVDGIARIKEMFATDGAPHDVTSSPNIQRGDRVTYGTEGLPMKANGGSPERPL